MDATPKPKPPVQKLVPIQPAVKASPEKAKTPYVRKPHLTDRPLKDNAALQAMKQKLEASKAAHPSNRNKRTNSK